MVHIYMNIYNFKVKTECSHSAESSPQVRFGKQERFSPWQVNNWRQYLTVIIIITISILRLYSIYVHVCALQLTLQVLLI